MQTVGKLKIEVILKKVEGNKESASFVMHTAHGPEAEFMNVQFS